MEIAGGFAVEALHSCPHAQAAARSGAFDLPALERADCEAACAGDESELACGDRSAESWLCLGCARVSCGRYARGHAARHFEASQRVAPPSSSGSSSASSSSSSAFSASSASPCCCALAFSLADSSVWCYLCDAYVDVFVERALHAPFRAAYLARHREEPVLPR